MQVTLDSATLQPTGSPLAGHQDTISDVLFDRTQPHLLFSASVDRTARGWDLRTRGQVLQLNHTDEVRCFVCLRFTLLALFFDRLCLACLPFFSTFLQNLP